MAGQLDNSPALRTRGKKRHAAEVSSAHMPAQQERKVIKLTADSRSAAYAAGVQHVSRDMPMLESDESGQHGLEGASSEEEQEGIELLMGFCGADE